MAAGRRKGLTLSIRSLDGKRGPARSVLRKAVCSALEAMPPRRYAVEVAYADDDIMDSLNRRFHGRDGCTDVLAFPSHQELPGGEYLLGEVVVNRDEARRHDGEGGGVYAELVRYVVHGVLHMAGYDDALPEQRERMWHVQEEAISAALGKGSE
ncbi:MAG: rRNA maturation RNase YbeY [Planctomycetes bacterium]|nr:rRNA maturation RNase YbeY [Planctomycetota bacterium]